jgi:hypothetical protein
MGEAGHDTVEVWEHIYGERPGYVALFSGYRPPSAKTPNTNSIDRAIVRQKYYAWPEEAEQAARWVHQESLDGREVYHCGHLVTCHRRKKENAAPMVALYVDGDGDKVPED